MATGENADAGRNEETRRNEATGRDENEGKLEEILWQQEEIKIQGERQKLEEMRQQEIKILDIRYQKET